MEDMEVFCGIQYTHKKKLTTRKVQNIFPLCHSIYIRTPYG